MSIGLQSVPILFRKPSTLRWLGPFRVAVVAFLLTLLPGYFLGWQLEDEWRYKAWLRESLVREELRVPVQVVLPHPQQCTLGQAVAQLRRQVRVPMEMSDRIASMVIDPQYLVDRGDGTKSIYEGPLDTVLNGLLASVGHETLAYRVEWGRIVIASSAAGKHQLFLGTYPIPSGGPNQIALTEEAMHRLITTTGDADWWENVGGPCRATVSPGGITVAATSDVHRNIRRLLKQLAALPAAPHCLQPVPFLDSGSYGPFVQNEAEARVLRTLERNGSFKYSQVPLREFLRDISSRFDVPVVIAVKELEAAAVSIDTPVTMDLPDVSLRSSLRHALGDFNLTYFTRADGVVVTTPEGNCANALCYWAYPVHDLLELDPEGGIGQIIDLITTEVDPDSWEEVGGPGSIIPLSSGWLFVAQDQDAHRRMEQFLNELRHAARSSTWPTSDLHPGRQGVVHIETALRAVDRLHADVLPLREFASQLQRQLNIPVVVYTKKLEEAAIDLDEPICCHLEKQPLWRWLRETLAMHSLSFQIEDDVLEITTPEDARSRLRRAVFNLRDLTTPGLGQISKQTLANLIIHSIDPDSWESRGGAAFMNWLGDCLIVCHDDLTQFEVHELIEYLREHQAALPRLADLEKLDKDGEMYRQLLAESETTIDRWRSAWLRFGLGVPLPPPERIGPFRHPNGYFGPSDFRFPFAVPPPAAPQK